MINQNRHRKRKERDGHEKNDGGACTERTGAGAFRLRIYQALPKLSGEYESLESQIDALLSSGAEYAAPTSGSNLQSVQMIDLDGDGEEEAVAFFRRANDKKPMKICIVMALLKQQ